MGTSLVRTEKQIKTLVVQSSHTYQGGHFKKESWKFHVGGNGMKQQGCFLAGGSMSW